MDWRQIANLIREGSYRGLTRTTQSVAIGVLLIATFSIFMVVRLKGGRISNYDLQSSSCQFPAIYNFGDSNSDTGAVSAVFGSVLPPNGMTYFHKPSGRYSDGRLIIDFIAERLGLPYLSAFLDSIGSNFRHGANFAASGCTIQPADSLMLNRTFNPLTLDIQLLQFEQFKKRSSELYLEGPEKSFDIKDRLPRPADFTRALYTFDIGQNDLHAGIISMKEEQVKTYIPTIINEFASVVEKLYQGGARRFWIHNTGPIGCLPFFVHNYPPSPDNTDQVGCVKSYNKIAQEFNKRLQDKVLQLGTKLQETSFVYVDIFSVKYSLISEANKLGFTDPLGQCVAQDGSVCANPLEYISWDGIHYTEAANKWIVNRLEDGSVCSPKIPLTKACQTLTDVRQ
ncbi:GDSL esterase/lipase At3g26430-like isoform X1 [Cynara cardunculus var. scolymus]|uniref:GDSL esterase/lipase At3g26430-like isoform X1 n=1 Tax=Cynara cardunculus var. scolymus TaxID=59895 RepID=UPI000D62EB4E|nr:GDSL esterase/lipase At3g26430-like isoform X1 [Cynara cardunculus var. scolymus]